MKLTNYFIEFAADLHFHCRCSGLVKGLNRPRSSVIFGIFSSFTDDVNAEQGVVVEDLFVSSPVGKSVPVPMTQRGHLIGGS